MSRICQSTIQGDNLRQGRRNGFLELAIIWRTRTATRGRGDWQAVNRIAIEELEAWFFGAWASVKAAYPRVSGNIGLHAAYRYPDAIKGGTWEALEKILARAGYFGLGLRKTEIATSIGRHMRPEANTSPRFAAFRAALLDAVTHPPNPLIRGPPLATKRP